ncbi:hypothetical protein [Streptomyces sp. NPDC002078]
MELSETPIPATYPDAYWVAGDEVYQLTEPIGLRRTSRLRANINLNLLLHRRLFLRDTSLLVSPSLFSLLTDEDFGPGYQQLFRDGLIVPQMRIQANNFAEVAELIIEGRNFVAEMTQEQIRESARLLDSLNPQVVHTDTQSEMLQIGTNYLLKAEYWANLGLPEEHAEAMTREVVRKLEDRKLEAVRQTEFWEYANDSLFRPDDVKQAQQIRTYMTIASLGTMAKKVGVPPIYPAAYGQNVDRMYGTRTPWALRPDGNLKLLEPFESKTPKRISEERDIHQLAALLNAEQVFKIRGRGEHRQFLKELERAAGEDDYESPLILESALREYRESLEVSAGEFVTQWEHQGPKVMWETRLGQFIRMPIPTAVGYTLTKANEYQHLVPNPEGWVGPTAGLTVSAALTLFTWRKVEKATSRRDLFRKAAWEAINDPTVIPELRSEGCIEMNLFGTIPHHFPSAEGEGP